ncbi:heme NO-binding domain-containing protein [Agaribacterium sp. ZY112]|uniref:heme NO-binding domain-containing protein n=1 Tax=Agaribacterium sp. ZY112 TaxID=3233574 RepID=UPI0035254280
MKGAVFIALNELVESQYGLEAWETLLNKVEPKCGGVYVSTEDYPDTDVQLFVEEISALLQRPSTEVTRIFGHFLFSELNTKYPIFSQQCSELFEFLDSIEKVIHKEVRKLYDNPSLPSLTCNRISTNKLKIEYRSPRKLCYLAEGLVQGASEHYQTPISLEHSSCMHKGDEHCCFLIQKIDNNH